MDFRQLQYICEVAEYHSITKAARVLYISQPALSHYISKVEEELGVVLFNRSTTPISLTYAGELYVETARQILQLSNRINKQFRDISNNLRGTLRVGIPHDRAAYMLPRILPVFRSEFPQIEVQLHTEYSEGLIDELYKGRTNIVIMPYSGEDKRLETQIICREEFLVVAGKGMIQPEHLAPNTKSTVELCKLEKLPFLLLQKGHASRTAADALFKECGISPRIALETNSNITSYRLAATGLGVTIIPTMVTKFVQRAPHAELFSIIPKSFHWDVHAIYLREAFMGTVEQRFIQIARDLFA
jgi:Transcriptional regulator